MAAHLCDLLAKALRTGDMYDCASAIARIIANERAEEFYRFGLGCYGLSPADIDAACEAIARGEHPAGSLPGLVTEIRDRATVPGHPCPQGETEWNIYGRKVCAMDVLDLLGRKVTP